MDNNNIQNNGMQTNNVAAQTPVEPVQQPVQPVMQNVAQPSIEQPAMQNVVQPAQQPVMQNVAQPNVEQPAMQNVVQPAQQPAMQNFAKPNVEQPAMQNVVQPNVGQPAMQNVVQPVNNGFVAQPTNVNMNTVNGGVEPQAQKKSGKGLLIAIIAIVAVVLIGAGVAVYFIFFKPVTAKQVVNGTIDAVFKKAANIEDKITDNLVLDYKTQTIDYSGSLTLDLNLTGTAYDSLSTYKDSFKNIELNYDFIIDAKGQKLSFTADTKQNSKDILDIEGFIKDKILYINSDVFNHPYKMDLSEDLDWDELNIDDLPEIDSQAYTRITDKAKEFIESAIKEEYLTQEKGTYTVDGNTVKGYKNTILLSEKKKAEICSSVLNQAKADSQFVKDLANVTGKTEDEIKDAIDEYLDNYDIDSSSEETEQTLNIYTTTKGSFLALEILQAKEDEDKSNIYVVKNGDNVLIKSVVDGEENSATYNTSTGELKCTLTQTSEDSDEEKTYDVTIKFADDEIDVTISNDEIAIKASVKNSTSDKKISLDGSASVEMTDKENGMSVSTTYKNSFEAVQDIKTFSTTKATNLEELTEDEANTILTNAYSKVKGTYLEVVYQIFNSLNTSAYSSTSYDVDLTDATSYYSIDE